MKISSIPELLSLFLFSLILSCSLNESIGPTTPEHVGARLTLSSPTGGEKENSDSTGTENVFYDSTCADITVSIDHIIYEQIDSAFLQLCDKNGSCSRLVCTFINEEILKNEGIEKIHEKDSTVLEKFNAQTHVYTFEKKFTFFQSGHWSLKLEIYPKGASEPIYPAPPKRIFLVPTKPLIQSFFSDTTLAISPLIDTGEFDYSLSVPNAQDTIIFTPLTNNPFAHIIINGRDISSDSIEPEFDLDIGENKFEINIMADDNETGNTYLLTITRELSNDATMQSIVIRDTRLDPPFESGRGNYAASVKNTIGKISLTAEASHPGARISVDTIQFDSSLYKDSLALEVGDNTFLFTVTAEDGSTQREYTVTITREMSTISTLDLLKPLSGSLVPPFEPNNNEYELTVDNDIDAVSFSCTPTHMKATITINNDDPTREISLPANTKTPLTIAVTSEDGESTTTYRVTVFREGSAIATLAELFPSSGSLVPAFHPDSTTYELRIPSDVSGITLKPKATISGSSIDIKGSSVATGEWSDKLQVKPGYNPEISVLVTAEKEQFTKAYSITPNRAYVMTTVTTGNGSVSPGDVKDVFFGVPVTIVATPEKGSEFTEWSITSGNGTVKDPKADSTTILVESSLELSAAFSLKQYKLAAVEPSYGSIVVPSLAEHGIATAITATPDTGYEFVKWQVVSGSVTFDDSTDASTTVILESGVATISASFRIKHYSLQLSVEGEGTVEGPASLPHLGKGTIIAIPDTGYQFVEWVVREGKATILTPLRNFSEITMDSSGATVLARFERKLFKVTYSHEGDGTVSGKDTVRFGLGLSVTAVPEQYNHFVEWYSESDGVKFDDSSSTTTAYLTTGDATVSARFARDTYTLTIEENSHGSFTGGGTVTHGEKHTVTAIPEKGYDFVGWVYDSTLAYIENHDSSSTIIILTKGDVTIKAKFKLKTYFFTILAGDSMGTVCGLKEDTIITLQHGESYDIKAIPNTGFHFSGWSAEKGSLLFDSSTSATTHVKLEDGNATVKGSFAINMYPLSMNIEGEGEIIATDTAGNILANKTLVAHGDRINIRAQKKDGSHFSHWTISGKMSIDDENSSLTNIVFFDSTARLTVVFNYDKYQFNFSKPTNGTIYGDTGIVEFSKEYNIKAEPNLGCYFVKWFSFQDSAIISDSTSQEATVSFFGNDILCAEFDFIKYTLSLSKNGDGKILDSTGAPIYGDVSLFYDEKIFVEAIPSDSCNFIEWNTVSGSPTYCGGSNKNDSIISVKLLDGEATIQAIFELKKYDLKINYDSLGTVANYNLTVTHGKETQIEANPGAGCIFNGWTTSNDDSIIIKDPDDPITSVIVRCSDPKITAHFERKTFILTIKDPDSMGTITPPPPFIELPYQTDTQIVIKEDTGYTFLNWDANGYANVHNTESKKTFINITGPSTLWANFKLNRYKLTGDINPGESGRFEHIPDSLDHFTTDSISFIPAKGYLFKRWNTKEYKIDSIKPTELTTPISLRESATITAECDTMNYPFSVVNISNGSVDSPQDPLKHFRDYPIKATPDEGYHFVCWKKVSGPVEFEDDSAESTTTSVTGEASITALFEINRYTLSFDSSKYGYIKGPNSVEHNKVVQCTAVVNKPYAYTFSSWESSKNIIAINSPNTEITTVRLVNGDATLKANFTDQTYPVKIMTKCIGDDCGDNFGSVTPSIDTVKYNDSLKIEAQEDNDNYYFMEWTFTNPVSYDEIKITQPESLSTFIVFKPQTWFNNTIEVFAKFARKPENSGY